MKAKPAKKNIRKAFSVQPCAWIQLITAGSVRVVADPGDVANRAALSDWFIAESLAVARVLDGAAVIAGDFRIDTAGHMRFAVFSGPQTGARRIGRIVQRLCEIETYKAMSMLGFARTRSLSGALVDLDNRLTRLMIAMTGTETPAPMTLTTILSLMTILSKN